MEPATYVEIMKQGTMGAVFLVVCVPLALAYKAQARELKESQDRRATDAQATTDKLLALNDRWNSVMSDQVRMMGNLVITMSDLKQAMQAIHDGLLRGMK